MKGHIKFEHMTCKLCRNPCFSVANLKIHNKALHPESHTCDTCGFIFPNNIGHQVHMNKNHPQDECAHCEKKFKSKRHMVQHLRKKSSGRLD